MSVGPGADRWREIDALFRRALDRPTQERARFVREEAMCASPVPFLREVPPASHQVA